MNKQLHGQRVVRFYSPLVVFVTIFFGPAGAQADGPLSLKPSSHAGDLRQAAISFEVGGDLLMNSDGKELKMPMSVSAKFKYQERLLAPAAGAMAAAARYYDHTDAKIKVDGRPITPTLRPERRLVGVSLRKEDLSIICPAAALTREELDLIMLPADSLVIEGLLPQNPVRPGDTWSPSDATLAALLDLDVVGQSQVEAMLIEVEKGRAKIELKGTVNGAAGGVSSQIEMKARCYYAIAAQRLEDVELIYQEKRGISHASPGVDVTAKLRIQVAPIKQCDALAPEKLADLALTPSAKNELLEYVSSAKKFQVSHDRLWFVAREDAASTILRRVERGDLVAQCNITALSPLKKDRRTTLDTFQEDIKKSLGDHFSQFASAVEDQNKDGRLVYRVTATGRVSELDVEWIYYLVQDSEGRRTSVVFTLEQSLVEKFAAADRPLVASLAMLAPSTASPTKQPTPDAAAAATPKAPETPVDQSVAVPKRSSDEAKKPDITKKVSAETQPTPPTQSSAQRPGRTLRR